MTGSPSVERWAIITPQGMLCCSRTSPCGPIGAGRDWAPLCSAGRWASGRNRPRRRWWSPRWRTRDTALGAHIWTRRHDCDFTSEQARSWCRLPTSSRPSGTDPRGCGACSSSALTRGARQCRGTRYSLSSTSTWSWPRGRRRDWPIPSTLPSAVRWNPSRTISRCGRCPGRVR